MSMYKPSDVWRILRGGDEVTLEETIDVENALKNVGWKYGAVLRWYGNGYGAGDAMRKAGVVGNTTRFMDEAVGAVTDKMNGGSQSQGGNKS